MRINMVVFVDNSDGLLISFIDKYRAKIRISSEKNGICPFFYYFCIVKINFRVPVLHAVRL